MQADSSFASGFLRRLGFAGLVLAMAWWPLDAHAETQIFSVFDFQFEDGSTMPELRIAYETWGTLSASRDNAVLLLHDALADHHAFDNTIGQGKLFDTDKYFVIAADAIGGGESSSPADGKGQDFPRYTIRDIMAAEYALVTNGLGLTRLRVIVGRSLGATVALEWAVHHPEMPKSLVLLAPSARSDANLQIVIDLLTAAVALDPEWGGGRYERNPLEGLRHAGMIYYPWSVSAAYLDRLPPATLAEESEKAAKDFAAWDANALVLRLAAWRGHDVGGPFAGDSDAALARVSMPVLLLPSASDRLVDPAGARWLRTKLPHQSYVEMPSDEGHRAIAAAPGTQEGAFIDRAIRGFLK